MIEGRRDGGGFEKLRKLPGRESLLVAGAEKKPTLK